jgi:hypothetical protein
MQALTCFIFASAPPVEGGLQTNQELIHGNR